MVDLRLRISIIASTSGLSSRDTALRTPFFTMLLFSEAHSAGDLVHQVVVAVCSRHGGTDVRELHMQTMVCYGCCIIVNIFLIRVVDVGPLLSGRGVNGRVICVDLPFP